MAMLGKRAMPHMQALGRFLLLLAIPVASGLLMWLLAKQAERRAELVTHTLQVQRSLESLVADLKNASSSHRGYLLTGDEAFLQTYRETTAASLREISQLVALTAENPEQQKALNQIRPLVEERFKYLESEQELFRAGTLDQTAIRVGTEEDKLRHRLLLDRIAVMKQEEERLLNRLTSALDITAARFYRLLYLGYALIVILVASLYLSVRRYGQQAEAAESHLSQLNAELDQRVRERTALLKAREDLLNTFIQHMPIPVAMLDREMRYIQMSDSWCTANRIERSRSIGVSNYDLVPDIPEHWKEVHRRCLAGETLRSEEDRWDRPDSQTLWLRWEVRPWGNRDGLPEGILILAEDITERKNIEEALRESEETNRMLLENASQGILAINANGIIVMANRMVNSMFEYAPNELIGQPHEVLIPDESKESHSEYVAQFFAEPNVHRMRAPKELTGRRKDGSCFPVEISLSTVHTKRGLLAISFITDVTDRKQAENALRESEERLRALTGQLMTAQEEERRNLARELHDDLTQELAFLSIELGRIAKELPDSQQENRERVQALQAQVFRATSGVRRLSHGLHPSVITDFGLSGALEEFCAEFESFHEVAVDYEAPYEDMKISGVIATCLFRIAQESLKNAVVHGHATNIRVTLGVNDGHIQLQVKDNGTGFAVESSPTKARLGLISMTERIRLVNGTLKVSSAPGKGTEITALAPITEVKYDSHTDSIG